MDIPLLGIDLNIYSSSRLYELLYMHLQKIAKREFLPYSQNLGSSLSLKSITLCTRISPKNKDLVLWSGRNAACYWLTQKPGNYLEKSAKSTPLRHSFFPQLSHPLISLPPSSHLQVDGRPLISGRWWLFHKLGRGSACAWREHVPELHAHGFFLWNMVWQWLLLFLLCRMLQTHRERTCCRCPQHHPRVAPPQSLHLPSKLHEDLDCLLFL